MQHPLLVAEPKLHLCPSSCEDGFTLIEVLVALMILAVASAGLIGAAERHVDAIRSLQTRAAASWVAENRIVELTADPQLTAPAVDQVEMLGRIWTVQVLRRPSDDPDLEAMRISVSESGEAEAAVTLDFFRERGGSAFR